MTRRPTWPEVLSLFEELRFQVAIVGVVTVLGAVAIAVTLPKPGWLQPSSTTRSTAVEDVDAETSPAAAIAIEATTPASVAEPQTTAAPDEEPARLIGTRGSLASRLVRPVVSTPAVPEAVRAGEHAQLVAPAPMRLSCTEDEPPTGVLLSGRQVLVIETGIAACEGWVLVQSDDGLTWLRPSTLEVAP